MNIFRERQLGNCEYDEYDIINIFRERRLGNCEYDEYDIMNIFRERRLGNCEYDEYENQDIGFADIQTSASNPEEVINIKTSKVS